jgi:tetratricopeptide (TPR) repeat protein
MKSMLLSFWVGILLLNGNHKIDPLTKDQVIEVKKSINAFTSAIEMYSSCKKDEVAERYIQVIELVDSLQATNFMCNDLFAFGINPDTTENYDNWGTYLDKIQFDFQNNIDVDFANVSVINCVDDNKGKFYTCATIDKTLIYNNEKYTCTIYLWVNLNNGGAIKEAVSARYFKKTDTICHIGVDNSDVLNQANLLRTKADDYFQNKKDYIAAKKSYAAILNILPENSTIKNKIEECDKLITYETLLKNAEQKFANKKYSNAKEIYIELLTDEKSDKNLIRKRIMLCERGIIEKNYNEQINVADYYFHVANFEKAREYYKKALNYKQDDAYALSQIEKAEVGDKTFVKSEIEKAVKLAESGKRHYAEAFKIMTKYELSGLLTTDNYAFLTLMMLSKNKDIRNELHYTNKMFNNFFNIYVKKLSDKNKIHPTSQSSFLLDEVVNKRYQK